MGKQPKTIRLTGRVFSGTGEGSKFIELSWVRSQIEEKLGFTPFRGTLNLLLDETGSNIRKALENAKPVPIVPEPGFRPGKCFKASIMGLVDGAVVIPLVEGYPKNVLEVIAPVNLRERFGLKDGDVIEVSVFVE
ncbi:MAG: CTP-dependent riboflavin kinase [Candidatus Bathyarchaeota archaeon]|nr:CTP-dependent riboflavin kinase [Candidatus Bathyarchaeota archaeon]